MANIKFFADTAAGTIEFARVDNRNTAAAIRSEIARIEAQIADWSQRFPMGDAEPDLQAEISDLRDELYVLEHPEEFAPISQKEAA